MLEVQDLYSGYGTAKVLNGAGLTVKRGEIVVLMGRSGSGKSSLLKTMMGLTPATSGTIRFNGRNITHYSPHVRSGVGLGYVPDDNRLFGGLTVHEHFLAVSRPGPMTPLQIYRVFPALRSKRSQVEKKLSAVERQMLAMGRALATNPHILLIDRGTEGLSPSARKDILGVIGSLKGMGMGLLLVDLHLEELRYVADRFLLMESGKISFEADRTQILMSPERLERLLAI